MGDQRQQVISVEAAPARKQSKSIMDSKSGWKQQMFQVFCEFCESTSLHGYSYLQMGNSWIIKLLWVCGISSMIVLGASFLYQNTSDYLSSTLVTLIESSTEPLKVIKANKPRKIISILSHLQNNE